MENSHFVYDADKMSIRITQSANFEYFAPSVNLHNLFNILIDYGYDLDRMSSQSLNVIINFRERGCVCRKVREYYPADVLYI